MIGTVLDVSRELVEIIYLPISISDPTPTEPAVTATNLDKWTTEPLVKVEHLRISHTTISFYFLFASGIKSYHAAGHHIAAELTASGRLLKGSISRLAANKVD